MRHNQLIYADALLLHSLFDSNKVARLGNSENNGATNTDLKKFILFRLLHDKVVLNLRHGVQLFIFLLSYMVNFVLLVILLVV